MNAPALCPNCGAALPRTPSGLAGLCPACMWKDLCEPEEAAVASSRRGAGMQLPGYEIVQEIARGGMGIVYRARQLDPSRTVALKMLLPHQLGSSEMAQRFRLEVRALAELEHPGILPVFQAGEHEGMPFFTMKFANGALGEDRGINRDAGRCAPVRARTWCVAPGFEARQCFV